MNRAGPGFLADLAILWLTLMASLLVAQVAVGQLGRWTGLAVAAIVSAVLFFLVLVAYYRAFLEERPVLGTAARGRFVVLWVQLVLVGFVLGAVLTPPDPFTQILVVLPTILLATVLSYWLVYHRNDGAGSHDPLQSPPGT